MNCYQEYFCLLPTKRCSCKVYKNIEPNLCYEIFSCYCNENQKTYLQSLEHLFTTFRKKNLVDRTMYQGTNVRATCVMPARSARNTIIL